MNIQAESIRLSIKFPTEIKGYGFDERGKVEADDFYKAKVMENIFEYLNGGMNPGEVEWFMDRYMEQCEEHDKAYLVDDIFDFFGVYPAKKPFVPDPDNLLEPGRFYYHQALQIAPPPPTVTMMEDGTFKDEEQSFYLEIRERFTLDDLVNYFNEKMGRDGSYTRERDKGAFRHLLKRYDLDTILYTIDEARVLAEDLDKPLPRSPLDIEEYVEEGMAILEARKNICHAEGLDRVIPRPRQSVY